MILTCLSDSAPLLVVPAAVGGAVGGAVVIIIIVLVIIAAVLLIRLKGRGARSPQSYEVKEQKAMDIEMKPNSVYGLAREGIATKSNEAYGVSQPNPLTEADYDYVIPNL